jgi:hypothetical protein
MALALNVYCLCLSISHSFFFDSQNTKKKIQIPISRTDFQIKLCVEKVDVDRIEEENEEENIFY